MPQRQRVVRHRLRKRRQRLELGKGRRSVRGDSVRRFGRRLHHRHVLDHQRAHGERVQLARRRVAGDVLLLLQVALPLARVHLGRHRRAVLAVARVVRGRLRHVHRRQLHRPALDGDADAALLLAHPRQHALVVPLHRLLARQKLLGAQPRDQAATADDVAALGDERVQRHLGHQEPLLLEARLDDAHARLQVLLLLVLQLHLVRADHLRVPQRRALRVEEVLLALQRLRLALQRHLHALVAQAVVVLADARRQALLLLRVVQQHALLVHPVAQRVPRVVDVHAVAHNRVVQRNHEEHLALLLLDPAVVPHLLLRVDQRVVQLPRVKPHRIQAIVRIERRGGFHAPQRKDDHVAGRDGQLDRLLEQLLLHQLRSFFGRHHVGSTVECQ